MRNTLCLTAAALVLAAMSASAADTPGVTATEIKIGNTMPYSGPASSYGVIGKTEAAFFKMINEQGGVAGRKINFISLDDGYSPPKTVEQTQQAGRAGRGGVHVQHAGHAAQHGDREISQRAQGAAAVRRDRRRQMGRTTRISPGRSASSRAIAPRRRSTPNTFCKNKPDAKIARALSERRFRQGLCRSASRTRSATNTPRWW